VGAIYTIKAIKDVLLVFNGNKMSNDTKINDVNNANTSNSTSNNTSNNTNRPKIAGGSDIAIHGKNIIVNMKSESDLNGSMVGEEFDEFVRAMDKVNPSPEPSTDEDLATTIINDIDTTDLPDMDDMIFVDQDEQAYCPDSDTHEQRSATDRDTPASEAKNSNGGLLGLVGNYAGRE